MKGLCYREERGGKAIQRVPPNEQEIDVCMDKWGPQALPNDALGMGQDGLEKRGSWPLRSQSGHLSRRHVNHRIKHTGMGREDGVRMDPNMTFLLTPGAGTWKRSYI